MEVAIINEESSLLVISSTIHMCRIEDFVMAFNRLTESRTTILLCIFGTGHVLPEKGRFFAILVYVAWRQIWNLRTNQVIKTSERTPDDREIYNQWLRAINCALQRDRLLTDKIKFGPLTLIGPEHLERSIDGRGLVAR
jgi:hypothetical protein